jgi:hypothetical protein
VLYELAYFGMPAGLAVLFICLGAALAGLVFGIYFYRREPSISTKFYKISWYAQTILQTAAIIGILATFLGPSGPVYGNFIEYQSTHLCIDRGYDFAYYPNGFGDATDAYKYYGRTGAFALVSNGTAVPRNISDIGIPRFTCNGTWVNQTTTAQVCSSVVQSFAGWK